MGWKGSGREWVGWGEGSVRRLTDRGFRYLGNGEDVEIDGSILVVKVKRERNLNEMLRGIIDILQFEKG